MTDKLAKVTGAEDLVQRLDPQLQTTAAPTSANLIQARAQLSTDPDMKAYFDEAFTEDHDDALLVSQLAKHIDAESAQYLVDEYRQLGEGIHLVSKETGRVIITLTEDDLWQPSAVPRESGGLAQPLRQIKPELAAFITSWTFDRAHEQQIVAQLARRGHQTALLVEEGDPRLLVATRAGRKHIVESLGRLRPEDLLRACGGTSAAFLQCFELVSEDPPDCHLVRGSINSGSVMGIHDQTTVNLHHNRSAVLRGALVQGWVREVARLIVGLGSSLKPAMPVKDISKAFLSTHDVWVAPPEAMIWLRRADPTKVVLPVPGITHILGVSPLYTAKKRPKAGVIVVPEQFGVTSRELFGRWEVESELNYAICVDWKYLQLFELTGLEYQSHVVS